MRGREGAFARNENPCFGCMTVFNPLVIRLRETPLTRVERRVQLPPPPLRKAPHLHHLEVVTWANAIAPAAACGDASSVRADGLHGGVPLQAGPSQRLRCPTCNRDVISRPIAKELAAHKTLRGLYKPRDPRFVAKAKDEDAHCGYQQWHRDVDRKVVEWLRRETDATPEEFMAFLRELYGRSEMRARFPHGF